MCSLCDGYVGVSCPVCGNGSLEVEECPDCGGLGYRGYFKFDIITREDIECDETEWNSLPAGEDEADLQGERYCRQELEPCRRCHGEGYVFR